MKDEFEGKIIGEFVGLKSKMYSMKNIDGKESNTAKGVNIATEFKEFKDTLFNKKIFRHKPRRIQNKNKFTQMIIMMIKKIFIKFSQILTDYHK